MEGACSNKFHLRHIIRSLLSPLLFMMHFNDLSHPEHYTVQIHHLNMTVLRALSRKFKFTAKVLKKTSRIGKVILANREREGEGEREREREREGGGGGRERGERERILDLSLFKLQKAQSKKRFSNFVLK